MKVSESFSLWWWKMFLHFLCPPHTSEIRPKQPDEWVSKPPIFPFASPFAKHLEAWLALPFGAVNLCAHRRSLSKTISTSEKPGSGTHWKELQIFDRVGLMERRPFSDYLGRVITCSHHEDFCMESGSCGSLHTASKCCIGVTHWQCNKYFQENQLFKS